MATICLNDVENGLKDFKLVCKRQIHSVPFAEELHKIVLVQRGKLQRELMNLDDVLAISKVDSQITKVFNKFTDRLVTLFPHAQINYGAMMVGPRRKWQPEDLHNPKLIELSQRFPNMRDIRGDGNCFLTSFTVGYLECLVASQQVNTFIEFIYNNQLDVHFKDVLVDALVDLPSNSEQVLAHNNKILPFVNYFRQITAQYIQKNSRNLNGFLEGINLPNYIEKIVLRMGVEADNIMIMALCTALKCPITIFDPVIDRSGKITETKICHQFGVPRMNLCRKGDHYFFLYNTDSADPLPVAELAEPLTLSLSAICDVGAGNNLYVRGSKDGLNWHKGESLHLTQNGWVWDSIRPLSKDLVYKFVVNDDPLYFEDGENRKIGDPDSMKRAPIFKKLPASIEALELPSYMTRVTVTGKGPFTIRGNGPGMDWQRDLPLQKIDDETWIFDMPNSFESCEYKILLNGIWEVNENRHISSGMKEIIRPRFQS